MIYKRFASRNPKKLFLFLLLFIYRLFCETINCQTKWAGKSSRWRNCLVIISNYFNLRWFIIKPKYTHNDIYITLYF